MENWWKERAVYQIYPRSFNDTNGDGVGDIPGIIEKLDYLRDLGIGVIWLSPVYKSPNEDNGYDISDYRDINPEYGTMADMDMLIAEAAKRDIKIIMDLVINHTSSQHEWFQKALAGDEKYRDYYIWREGKDGKEPNNWTSFFGGSTWELDEKSGEYYLHLFAKGQPDLNYYNPKVLEEIKDIMHFWLKKGIAGFRCDVINIIYKSSLEDGKSKLILTGSEYYISQQGTHDILKELRRDVLSHYDCFSVGETVFVTPKMGKELCDAQRGELDMIFSFEHMEVDQFFVKWFPRKFRPKKFFEVIVKWQDAMEWCANYFENHDQPRSVSRFCDDKNYHDVSAKMLSTMLLSLRGTPYIFQGQEIGMTNYDFKSLDEIEDVETHNIMKEAKNMGLPKWYRWKMIRRACRDLSRTPMQWTDGKNGGFTDGKPWLVVNENCKTINAAAQVGDEKSIYSYYKKMIELKRTNEVLKYGDFRPVKMTKNVFIYTREYDGKKLSILLNFTDKSIKQNYSGKVLISNYEDRAENTLRPYEAIIIEGV
ncbi:MAG: alpha-glucosidase [Eubacteriales bacterium]